MNEQEKMKAGLWYDANFDPDLVGIRHTAQALCQTFNTIPMTDDDTRYRLLEQLLGYKPDHPDIVSPFFCDYGTNIHLGSYVFINAFTYLMDCADITIGDHTFIGPHCGLYTATHPLGFKDRNKGLEKALPVTIGSNCWLGANVSILPGVTVGDGCVIAAGSVVNKDIPENSLVGGVPAKVIRTIDQDE